jgi:deoxyribose-phosphate aldolase
MANHKVRVAVDGYGVIGKRVADAVRQQPDMELVGVGDVASVCIVPYYLKRCAEVLADSNVKASTTIGFPHGGHTTAIKVAEAQRALADGGEELDMVANISRVLSRVKAAGGVRTLDRLLEVRALGVTRAGASRTTTILDTCKQRLGL